MSPEHKNEAYVQGRWGEDINREGFYHPAGASATLAIQLINK
jgi:hypothetical protein